MFRNDNNDWWYWLVACLLALVLGILSTKPARAQTAGAYEIVATAYVTTTISQNVVFDNTMRQGGTFTMSVLAHNGGGRAGQSDTANVRIQFYNMQGGLMGTFSSSYNANLPNPNAVCGNPCIDSSVPWSTLTVSTTVDAASAANIAYAKVSMYGIDGSYWAGDYGPWYRAPTFTLNGGGNLLYNPEFGPYNGTNVQGWTISPALGACQGAWGGSNACIVNSSGVAGSNTTGLIANQNGGGPSATGGTTSGQPGGYNSTMSVSSPTGGPTVVSTTTSNATKTVIVGSQVQTVTTPVTVKTYSDGTTQTTSGTATTTTNSNSAITGAHFGASQVADTQWDTYSCMYTNSCQIYSTAPGGTYQTGSWTAIGATQYITLIPNTDPNTNSANPWEMVLVSADGTFTSLGIGSVLIQGADGSGNIYIFFVASDGWTGTLLSGNLGLTGQGMTFTGTATPTATQTNTLAGGMSTIPLSAGQTGGTGAITAPTVTGTSNSTVITTTVTGNTTYYYTQPIVITTYSDGSTTSANDGSATLTGSQTTNSSTITASQQAQVTAVQQRQAAITPNTPNSIYIQQSGSGDNYNITQVGTGNKVDGATFNTSTGQTGYQTYAQFSGGTNSVTIRQGDPATRAGKNIVDVSVNGTGNYLNINQGTDANGLATGLDTGEHYQFVWVQGGNNNITTAQQGTNYQSQFGVITVNGTGNNIQQTQSGATNNQSFIGVQGSYNNIAVSQNGTTSNQGNYSSITASGNNNNATVTQTGGNNNANITLVNAGAPASVNLTQTGGQSYGITQTCYTSACGTITLRQGN